MFSNTLCVICPPISRETFYRYSWIAQCLVLIPFVRQIRIFSTSVDLVLLSAHQWTHHFLWLCIRTIIYDCSSESSWTQNQLLSFSEIKINSDDRLCMKVHGLLVTHVERYIRLEKKLINHILWTFQGGVKYFVIYPHWRLFPMPPRSSTFVRSVNIYRSHINLSFIATN